MLNSRGFTLLEILVSIVLLTIGVIAIIGLFSANFIGSIDAENTAIAVNLAEKRMEEIRNLDFDTGIVNEAKASVSGFAGFERQVVVAEPETDLKYVTVTAYWTYKTDEVSITLDTYVSKN